MRWLALIGALAVLSGCATARGDARYTIVATTTQVADLARNVAPDAHVVQLLQPNADPHEFEIRPHDVGALADADLILRSGGDVDDWLDEAIEGSGTDAPVVTLSDAMRRRGDDPHWWQDPRNAIVAVHEIERATHRTAPAYVERLQRLDRDVAACIAKVPPADRKLVTTHDALGYYAARYGLEVIGTVIPSRSTAAQPSAGDIAALVRTIRDAGVKAIFAETSVHPKVEQAIAAEAGAHVGRPLWADTLGPPGSDGATYIDSIRSNTSAIVDGLTGGETRC